MIARGMMFSSAIAYGLAFALSGGAACAQDGQDKILKLFEADERHDRSRQDDMTRQRLERAERSRASQSAPDQSPASASNSPAKPAKAIRENYPNGYIVFRRQGDITYYKFNDGYQTGIVTKSNGKCVDPRSLTDLVTYDCDWLLRELVKLHR